MPDPVTGRDSSRDGAAHARQHCPGCGADPNSLPTAARFCNRCGARLETAGAAGSTAPVGICARWLMSLWCGCHPDGHPVPTNLRTRSQVLLAYGKSMFNLGWRYEHAVGARRNLHEAARCYGKAARLGDPSARRRLSGESPDNASDESSPLPPLATLHCQNEPTPIAPWRPYPPAGTRIA